MADFPRVTECLFDLAVWCMEHTNRFPRNYRVTLGDRIDGAVIEMVLLGRRASLHRNKLTTLQELSDRLEEFRMLTRLAGKLGCLKGKQLEYVARSVDEIGRQLGGWIKQQTAKEA